MRDLTVVSVVLAALLLPVGCITPNYTTATNNDIHQPYLVGWFVTQNDICRKFRGVSAEKFKTEALRVHYQYDESFLHYYEQDRRLLEHKKVNGIEYCARTIDAVNKAYADITKT